MNLNVFRPWNSIIIFYIIELSDAHSTFIFSGNDNSVLACRWKIVKIQVCRSTHMQWKWNDNEYKELTRKRNEVYCQEDTPESWCAEQALWRQDVPQSDLRPQMLQKLILKKQNCKVMKSISRVPYCNKSLFPISKKYTLNCYFMHFFLGGSFASLHFTLSESHSSTRKK